MIRSILLASALLLLPSLADAHAGVMKTAGDIDVIYKQTPLSPFVGETVQMNFVLTKHDLNDQVRNHPVLLQVMDTYYGDETKDTLLKEEQLVTDVNGSINFEYAFAKENYFDIELSFTDLSGQEQETGFLIQTRKELSHQILAAMGVGMLLAIACFTLLRRFKQPLS
jgi:hypothetical protein